MLTRSFAVLSVPSLTFVEVPAEMRVKLDLASFS